MPDTDLIALLDRLLALPAETELLEFKTAGTSFGLDCVLPSKECNRNLEYTCLAGPKGAPFRHTLKKPDLGYFRGSKSGLRKAYS